MPGALDELTAFEAGSGAHECDEVGCVHGSPSGLGGLDELEDHGEGGGRATGAAGDLGPQADSGEGGLDRMGRPQVDPVLGGEVVERQQLVGVVGDLLDGLGKLRPVGLLERCDGLQGMLTVLGVVDLVQGLLRSWLGGRSSKIRPARRGLRHIRSLTGPGPSTRPSTNGWQAGSVGGRSAASCA